MSSIAERKFLEEFSQLMNKEITVETVKGTTYSGMLSGISVDSMSICLINAKDQNGRVMQKLFINGRAILEIYSVEKPFNLEALAERLDRVFPRMIKLVEGSGTILVMDKIRVNESGVVEGSGPAAERVRKVYDEFIRERSESS